MKKILIFILLSIMSNKTHAQNFTIYSSFNCGNINEIYADTTDSNLYIGGYIYPTNELNANGILSFQNEQFSALPGCSAWSIQAIKRFNGELYLGGSMYSADSTEQYTLAKWNGTTLEPVMVQGQTFTNDIGSINRIEVFNNELYIVGGFRFMDNDGVFANSIAKLVDGEFKSIHNFPQWNVGNLNIVDCFTIFHNEIYVGGRIFDESPLDTMKHICKWNGTSWQMLGNGITGSLTLVSDMLEFQGKLYISGTFTDPSRNLAVWNGSNWEETIDVFCSYVGYGGAIYTMQVYNNELYIGGLFDSVAGIPASNFAKFDGNEWCTFLNDTLKDLIFDMEDYNGDLYLAGLISYVDGIDYNDVFQTGYNIIAKLNSSGTIFTCIDVVGLNEQQKSKPEIEIYPNPTNGIFELKNISDVNEISISDVSGKVVKKFKNMSQNESKKFEVDVSDLPSGFYTVVLISNEQINNVKLFKE